MTKKQLWKFTKRTFTGDEPLGIGIVGLMGWATIVVLSYELHGEVATELAWFAFIYGLLAYGIVVLTWKWWKK